MNYSSLLSVLDSLEVEKSPSQIHGLLCGLLCTGTLERAKSLWFSVVLEHFSDRPEKLRESGESIKSLDGFFTSSVEQLNDAEFGFQLLLEDETESAHTRLVQVASWCSGFGFGFGMGDHATSATRLPEDTEELLLDFQEIAKFETLEDTDGVDADEDGTDQSDVVEIEEFVRVGVLLINEEMRPPPASADNKTVGFDDFDSESDEPRTLH